MNDVVVVINNSSANNAREYLYVNKADVEALKSMLTENDTLRQVSQEEFDDYVSQAERQKEERELRKQINNYCKHLDNIGVFNYIGNPFRHPIPTKETIMKGFTQVKGRKHLSKKKRKQLTKK